MPRRAGGGRGDAVSRPRGGRPAPSRRRPRRPAPAGCPRGSSAARAAAAASTGSPAAERAPDSVVSRAASSRSTSHGPRGVSPYERPVAASRSAPRSLRVRLTRVATLAAGSAGASSGHNASTMRSSGTSAPRSVASSASKVRALRLPSSRPVSVSPPGTSTASAEASRIRVVPWPSSTPPSMRQPAIRLRFAAGFLAQRLQTNRVARPGRAPRRRSGRVTSRWLRRDRLVGAAALAVVPAQQERGRRPGRRRSTSRPVSNPYSER